jgi:hypothetical protein
MVASYDEFATEHRGEHLTPFNRWCAATGNPLFVLGAVSMLLGRPRSGAALAGSGLAITAAGHIVEGNLPRSLRDLARHPIWVRAGRFRPRTRDDHGRSPRAATETGVVARLASRKLVELCCPFSGRAAA